MKGLTKDMAHKETVKLMLLLKLEEKRQSYWPQLSMGIRRKLSLAMALIGGSQVSHSTFIYLVYLLITFCRY